MGIRFDPCPAFRYIERSEFEQKMESAASFCGRLIAADDTAGVLGWRDPASSAVWMKEMKEKAEEIRQDADVFVIVGVGGSNQAARAVIEAVPKEDGPKIVYLGNTLSAFTIDRTLKSLEGKRVCIDVIAKNFETLEPGSHFRILRQWMSERYTPAEMKRRIVLTGTPGSRLDEIAVENGYAFFHFPEAVGGRYSAFSPVALLPLMAAGLDVDAYISGAESSYERCVSDALSSPAVSYAAMRNVLYGKGFDIEMFASFEPRLCCFEKWWQQLFGESEGKEKTGVFPTCSIYSEDLHSIGQYMQEGRRNLFETFLSIADPGARVVVPADPQFRDGFDYLDNTDFSEINKKAENATIKAHSEGGVPCLRFEADMIDEEMFGELFYTCMMACACSGLLNSINPFDQQGVEAYKISMFEALGKVES